MEAGHVSASCGSSSLVANAFVARVGPVITTASLTAHHSCTCWTCIFTFARAPSNQKSCFMSTIVGAETVTTMLLWLLLLLLQHFSFSKVMPDKVIDKRTDGLSIYRDGMLNLKSVERDFCRRINSNKKVTSTAGVHQMRLLHRHSLYY